MCKKSRLLLFNCSHEMALAANVKQYFPPKNILQMEADLCLLPLWWAEDGDAVVVDDVAEAQAFLREQRNVFPDVTFTTWAEGYDALRKRTGRDFIPAPWGWNKAVAERFRRYGVPSELIPDEDALAELRRLASREFVCGESFASLYDSSSHIVPHVPEFACSLDFPMPEGADRLIFKSPWSSSGRGVFVADVPLEESAKARLKGFLNTQGGFLVDRFYDKMMDFALEFDVDAGGVAHFLGFSVFETAEGGRYGGNVVAGQEDLRKMIETVAGFSVSSLVDSVKNSLERSLDGRYKGIAGVDMLIVIDEGEVKIHPCIEVNLRMNMGVLAAKVYERLSSHGIDLKSETTLTPERKCGFVAECVDGRLRVVFRKP